MQVRLAFSVMVQSDPDVMLIDEVLAVGDASFQQKCIDVFYRLRGEGKTIVLVTHEMGLVERFCHRAMKLSGGDITHIGDPAEIGRAYLSENFADYETAESGTPISGEVWLADSSVTDTRGERVDAIAYGEWMALNVAVEATEEIRDPAVTIWLTNEDGVRVFSAGARENGEALGDLQPGERLQFSVALQNRLSAGRYYVGCSVTRGSAGLDILLFQNRVTDVVSFGQDLHALVGMDYDPTVVRTKTRQPVQ
jgi:ABC-2 type transport system ATP-binding protein